MFENQKFQYTLVTNESEERFDERETANFKFPLRESGVIEAYEIDDCIDQLKKKFDYFSNRDWDWEGPEDGTKANLYFGNDQDGLSLVFEITLIK